MAEKVSKDESNSHVKIHILHQQMQEWAKTAPARVQQRMSCELLANLAGCLVSDSTVFEIVNSLIDIQHIVEKELFYKRKRMKNEYSAKILSLTAEKQSKEEFEEKKKEIHSQHKEELKEFDFTVIRTLDDKLTEQQQILESAGVPGFRQSSDSVEIQLQICLLDFIIRSGKK